MATCRAERSTIVPANQFYTVNNIQPAVFLPGWGFDGRVMTLTGHGDSWIYPTGPVSPASLTADLADFLDEQGINRIHLAGWSLGGNIALEFAERHPERLASLTLLAVRQTWPSQEIEAIRSELIANPREFMATFYRKCFMGYKEAYRTFTSTLQESYLAQMNMDFLLAGLGYLESLPKERPYTGPTTILHGDRDIVAPVGERIRLQNGREQIIRHAGHPVFLDRQFGFPSGQRKESIRRKFCRAAETYDQHARLQRELINHLADRLPVSPAPTKILEIGCGTGNFTARLAEQFPEAEIIGLDFAEKMVDLSQKKLAEHSQTRIICRDGEEFLSETTDEFDLITSNATLQWFDDLPAAMTRMAAALNPQGSLIASIFGPRTMEKVAQGLREVLGHREPFPSANFLDRTELENSLTRHFSAVSLEELIITREYASLHELLRHIQKTGTSGWQPTPPVLNRQRLARLDQWFADNFNGYHITYQVFLVTARRPKPD